ncbi:MAG: PaaI family thioesterase [Candidatus Dormibacteraeota bacterium]|nr:PaaI family thioesterase [Candidatus Dormibacteraeota bacterium]
MTNLEALRLGLRGEGPRAGWSEALGARFAEVEPGRVVVELIAAAQHLHPGGVVQGGVITQIADAAMGTSLLTLQPDQEANTTVNLKINFLRPVTEGRIQAIGRIIEMGEDLLFSEAQVINETGKLIAHASSTCLRIPRDGGWR